MLSRLDSEDGLECQVIRWVRKRRQTVRANSLFRWQLQNGDRYEPLRLVKGIINRSALLVVDSVVSSKLPCRECRLSVVQHRSIGTREARVTYHIVERLTSAAVEITRDNDVRTVGIVFSQVLN